MQAITMRSGLKVALSAFAALLSFPALAQPQTAPAPALVDSGDTAWVLAAGALALLASLPGLALLYGGRTGGAARGGQGAGIAKMGIAIAALASLVWIIAGYTIAFGASTGAPSWIGSGNAFLLSELGTVRPGTLIPESAFAFFQMGFAVLSAALLVGVFAGRARFSWALGFAGLWSLVVYAPIAHWLWGGGWLASQFGVLDYAGGLVVHTSVGISALVVILLLGPRSTDADENSDGETRGALSTAGAALIWIGLLALSGGAALGANDNAASALLASHIAASVGALSWMLLSRRSEGGPQWHLGALAGLAAMAPGAVFVSPWAAILVGALAASACYGAAQLVQNRLRLDDPHCVFAVHAVGGMLGTILLAVFMAPAFGGTGYFTGVTMAGQLASQAIGVVAVAIWSAFATAILALMVSFVVPMRAEEAEPVSS